jgi:mannosyltransferase
MAVDSLRARTPLPPSLLDEQRRPRLLSRLSGLQFSRPAVAGLVLLLTVASVLLRIGQLRFHFWIDEGISVGIASHPLSELPQLLREDGSPPLYYLLLHVWMQIFGRSEQATHELSLIFAVITVPVAYWGGGSLFGRRTGAYCAVLAAGLPFLTEYAQETRMYSLLLLLSLIAAVGFVHVFVFRRRRYLPVFAVGLAASLYTHNWALFLGLTSFVVFLVLVWMTPRELRGGLWRDGALAFGAVAVLYLPWVPTLLYQAQHTGAPWALPPVLWSFTQGGYFIVGGRGAGVALLLGAGAGLWAVRGAGPHERLNRTAIVSLMLLGIGTLVVAWSYAKFTPAWAFRYLAVIIGPLLLLVGFGLARAARLGLIALLLVCCFWVLDPKSPFVDSKSNVAGAARVIRARTGSDALVLSIQPEEIPTLDYYLPRVAHFATPLGPVPDPRVVDWRNALARFERSSVRSTLVPMLQAVTPGEKVVLVVPLRVPKAPLWMKLIRRSSKDWTRYLRRDHNFRLIKVTSPHAQLTGLAVRMSLYVAR